MRDTSRGGNLLKRWGMCGGAILLATGVLASQAAHAQEPPPPAPPGAPPVESAAAPAPVPMIPPPPAMAPPPAIEAAPKPPTAAESMPATRPETLPPITVGAWVRTGGTFQNQTDRSKMNDWRMDTAYAELHVGGKIHKKVGVTLNLNANMNSTTGVNLPIGQNPLVGIMDAIIQFDLADEFHVWAGRLLVPVDRANAAGPFFMIPWNYPGFIGTFVGAPKEGPYGRNNGLVVWGDVMNNKLTYLAGVFDNHDATSSPLYSGRLRLALWDTEPGFWGNASFFGEKDIFSLGLGAQYQKSGSATMAGDKAWVTVNGDVLVEKKLPGGGWVTAEAAYYHFNVADGAVSDSLYGLLAYATPTIGAGNIQPMGRYQWFKVKGNEGTNPSNIDLGLSYLIKGPALRLLATYSYTKLPGMEGGSVTANAIQLGAQAIFF